MKQIYQVLEITKNPRTHNEGTVGVSPLKSFDDFRDAENFVKQLERITKPEENSVFKITTIDLL